MSRDVIVITPNGRRQKVHCKPDTNILQILEEVCQKQGFSSVEYALKHHNHTLDLSTTIRFSNLPNKATLEMVEAERRREESNVTIGLQLEDGERRTADFTPSTPLYDLVMKLAPGELNAIQQPTILYMRQEVIGVPALQTKTLRQLGLIQGRAILRLLNKVADAKQANVSSVYRKSISTEEEKTSMNPNAMPSVSTAISSKLTSSTPCETAAPALPETSHNTNKHEKTFDPLKTIKQEKQAHSSQIAKGKKESNKLIADKGSESETKKSNKETPMEIDSQNAGSSCSPSMMQEQLERRLQIEDEVTFLGEQKAIAFMQPESTEDEVVDLPDEFYDLSIEEVRRLYHELQQQRKELENTPLLTAAKREEIQQTSSQRMSQYKNAVVRIQFPDRIILQGVFLPSNTIEDVANFVREHLNNPTKSFHLFTTPLKENLDLKKTLLEAGFVPGVHMHFKWAQENSGIPYLKQEIYSQITTSDAANILASKYRAPSRKRLENEASTSNQSAAGPSNTSNLPKWFKW